MIIKYTMRRLAGRGKRGSRLDLVWRGCMRHGVRLSRSSATTSGKAGSLRGGAALPTSCIRTAPSPHRRPSQLPSLLSSRSHFDSLFLAPCKHQSTSSRSHIGHTSLPPPFLPTDPPGPILLPQHHDRPARPLTDSTNSSNAQPAEDAALQESVDLANPLIYP